MMQLGLTQKQTVNLVMTTELRQAIDLLQYSTIDLSKMIQEQAMENPLIELEESYEPRFTRKTASPSSESVNPLDFIKTKENRLQENLIEQVQFLNITDQERSLLRYLIFNLDDNGYLPMTAAEIIDELKISEDMVEKCIQRLQQLEPIGVGARDLRECLLLQAAAYYPDEPVMEKVIRDYLEPLANKKWKKMASQLNLSLTEIKRILQYIQTLNPRPCAGLTSLPAEQYVYPDIVIDRNNGKYTVSMNDTYLPKIHLNKDYMGLLDRKNDTSKYISEQYKKFMWLVNSIEQRQATILKIVQVIIEKQRTFLENGLSSLKAMTMKEVAEEIHIHESTVSRATRNKFIRTPAGFFELSKLFSSKLSSSNGDDNTSSTTVKIMLQQYIHEEDKRKPYSDQKLADYFKNQGITISRRTVAKYREELNILSSSKRKEIV